MKQCVVTDPYHLEGMELMGGVCSYEAVIGINVSISLKIIGSNWK